MSIVWSWLCENYRFVIAVGLCLVEIIIVLVRRSYKITDSTKQYVLEKLPELINSAEASLLDGSSKKEVVITAMIHLIKEQFPNVSITSKLEDFISSSIEVILSTPKKKEVI